MIIILVIMDFKLSPGVESLCYPLIYTPQSPLYPYFKHNMPRYESEHLMDVSLVDKKAINYDQPQDTFYNTSVGDSSHFVQHDTKSESFTNFINDNIDGLVDYPFNTNSDYGTINNLNIFLNNTTLVITKNSLVANKPIMIEIRDKSLYIWSGVYLENKILNNKGSSIVDGYKVNDFDGKRIKVIKMFEYTKWNICKLSLSNIFIKGENNNFSIEDNIYNSDVSIKLTGLNHTFTSIPVNLNILNIITTFNNIDFSNSIVNNLKIEQNNGVLKGLIVNVMADLLIIEGNIYLKKNGDITIEQKIHGLGKIKID